MCSDSICPYARGFTPQELQCDLVERHEKKLGLPWYKRLWHMMCGEYDCPHEGYLPCKRFNDLTEVQL